MKSIKLIKKLFVKLEHSEFVFIVMNIKEEQHNIVKSLYIHIFYSQTEHRNQMI